MGTSYCTLVWDNVLVILTSKDIQCLLSCFVLFVLLYCYISLITYDLLKYCFSTANKAWAQVNYLFRSVHSVTLLMFMNGWVSQYYMVTHYLYHNVLKLVLCMCRHLRELPWLQLCAEDSFQRYFLENDWGFAIVYFLIYLFWLSLSK